MHVHTHTRTHTVIYYVLTSYVTKQRIYAIEQECLCFNQ